MDGGRDQRADKRIAVRLPVVLEGHGQRREAALLDLSAGGALVECDGFEWPEAGGALAINVNLDGHPMRLLARLVRRIGELRAGVAFVALDGVCDRILARYVIEQETEMLRKRQHLSE